MKKILILLSFVLFIYSCSDTKNIDDDTTKENVSSNNIKEDMFSSPNGGGNTGTLENDSFRN